MDFADVQTVMTNSGVALMGSGRASGEDRAMAVANMALESPLLNHNDIAGAKNILINITSGEEEITLEETYMITEYIQERAGNNADIIWGAGKDDSLGSDIEVTIIATGFDYNQMNMVSYCLCRAIRIRCAKACRPRSPGCRRSKGSRPSNRRPASRKVRSRLGYTSRSLRRRSRRLRKRPARSNGPLRDRPRLRRKILSPLRSLSRRSLRSATRSPISISTSWRTVRLSCVVT
ncbi:MAG: hypothetical protein ACLTTP_00865 [Alistipes ihumii]